MMKGSDVSQIVLRLSPLPRGGAQVDAGDDPPDPPVATAQADAPIGPPAHSLPPGTPTSLAHWAATIAAAHDACLLVDSRGSVVSVSVSGATALGCVAADAVGHPLLDVIKLVDFETGDSHPDYAPRIPPLGALKFVTLVRGLLRVRQPDDRLVTLDAVAAPLRDEAGEVVGSIAFLSAVTPG